MLVIITTVIMRIVCSILLTAGRATDGTRLYNMFHLGHKDLTTAREDLQTTKRASDSDGKVNISINFHQTDQLDNAPAESSSVSLQY